MTKRENITKNIVLFIGKAPHAAIQDYKANHPEHELAILLFEKIENLPSDRKKNYKETFDYILEAKASDTSSMIKALLPYKERILAVTCRSEAYIPEFAKVVPLLPYAKTPTSKSLEWSVDKISMRKRFSSHSKKINPRYKIAKDNSKETIEELECKVGYPMIVKPSGLAQSLLVTICYHKEELEKALQTIFKKIDKLHKTYKKLPDSEFGVIVEEFIEGDMYSIDGQINSRGTAYFYPPVQIKTGQTIGFDDFFGYKQILPSRLSAKSIKEAEEISKTALHALGLRSSSFHIELMKTERGWKVIEIGPRLGGFRNAMYKLSYDIDCTENDILIRIPKKPIVTKKVIAHSAALKFYPKKEGIIKSIQGIQKIKTLKSFHKLTINKKVGEKAYFAKNGGRSVFNIILSNPDRAKLLADIRRLEKLVTIETK